MHVMDILEILLMETSLNENPGKNEGKLGNWNLLIY